MAADLGCGTGLGRINGPLTFAQPEKLGAGAAIEAWTPG